MRGLPRIARGPLLRTIAGRSGQMSVELAVVLPVTIAVALAVVNLGLYIEACALFDRVALDAVIAHGVSPVGEQNRFSATSQVLACIEDAFSGSQRVSVEVDADELGFLGSERTVFSMAPGPVRYRCTIRMAVWPSTFSAAGVELGAPLELVHTRSFTVDPYRSGVVV